MSVYVDDMYKYPMGQFRRMKMSHMIADTEEELHAMAKHIGVSRKWYQGDHYDICITMRKRAIERGAKELTLRELAEKCRNVKQKHIDARITYPPELLPREPGAEVVLIEPKKQ